MTQIFNARPDRQCIENRAPKPMSASKTRCPAYECIENRVPKPMSASKMLVGTRLECIENLGWDISKTTEHLGVRMAL